MNSAEGGDNYGLSLEVRTLRDENDPQGEVLRDGVLRDNQEVAYYLKHEGNDPLWVTVLYLDANLGIQQKFARAVKPADQPLRFLRATMSAAHNSTGREGMVVFAIPQASLKEEPDFSFLQQEPLAVADEARRSPSQAPDTPFGKLLAAAAFNSPTRGMKPHVPSHPAVIAQTWVIVAR